jgi:hypothetical protein
MHRWDYVVTVGQATGEDVRAKEFQGIIEDLVPAI